MEKMQNHVVCVPYPAQGHIKPMLKLAQLLHFIFGFHVTFLNTHYFHKTYFQNYYSSSSSSNNIPNFKFESFPESFDYNSNDDQLSIITAILNNELKLPLKEILMSKLSSISSDNNSRLCCMISDVAMSSFTLGVAKELGIGAVLLETASACSLLAYFNTRQLLDKGIIPLQEKGDLTSDYLEKAIDWIPSLKGICLKDMPTSIRTTNPDDMFLNITMLNSNRALNSETILIINTFDALEQDVLRDLLTISPNIYPIGPLHSMVEHHISKNNNGDDTISIIGPTISCEDDENMMMNWLDSQEPNSVLYVSFGTLVGVTQETLVELAWGLANSHSNFLWIMRPGLVIGGCNSLEFDRFQKEVEGRGVIANWCDQERVLDHPSIGGFLTHCGWNSTIESISNGVPMICWPFAVDQTTNSWRCCHGLGIGVKMSEEVQRNAIEKVVKELMHEQKGNEIRTSAMKWKELTKEAIMKQQGSSYVNLDNLVQNIQKM